MISSPGSFSGYPWDSPGTLVPTACRSCEPRPDLDEPQSQNTLYWRKMAASGCGQAARCSVSEQLRGREGQSLLACASCGVLPAPPRGTGALLAVVPAPAFLPPPCRALPPLAPGSPPEHLRCHPAAVCPRALPPCPLQTCCLGPSHSGGRKSLPEGNFLLRGEGRGHRHWLCLLCV